MLAINYSTFRNNLKDYCDEASDNNQTIIVTRKKAKSIVIMSLDNVLAIVGATDGHLGMLAFGMIISVPIIVFGIDEPGNIVRAALGQPIGTVVGGN